MSKLEVEFTCMHSNMPAFQFWELNRRFVQIVHSLGREEKNSGVIIKLDTASTYKKIVFSSENDSVSKSNLLSKYGQKI